MCHLCVVTVIGETQVVNVVFLRGSMLLVTCLLIFAAVIGV